MTSAERVLPRAVEIHKPSAYVLEGLRKELSDRNRYSVEIKL
jgi:hypothetical protein